MSRQSDDLVISADSHVIEDPHLWETRLPVRYRDAAPRFPERGIGQQFQAHPGGWDPKERVAEMAIDGVCREILYPSLTMNLFSIADIPLQEACMTVYNDWLIDYCAVAPDQLFGVAALCTYDVDHAIAELVRCHDAGLVGAMVWEVPPVGLEFATDHYDPLWEVAQERGIPISLHSLTGQPYPWMKKATTEHQLSKSARHVNTVTLETANVVSDLITTGVLERFPRLNFVLVESEISWLPFYLSRYDNYYHRPSWTSSLTMEPSKYFERQFYATFFNDPTLGTLLQNWGIGNCMWSNDYPHPNSTWPNSRDVINRDLGTLDPADRQRLVFGNVFDLYQMDVPHMAT